ncbi:transcription initiation factor TFIIE subunit beta [Nematocida ausubeli]|nr:transcription initiation factor TFIIE subunit beta [Nematocida ausubeli]KAI5134093.1 transcription initiation factor TFIIE subunit beta [Nematocida ausubeli]KAI5160071.1 transcription initiation factor TFIIE subunit beta [Nematocida ausubeli]KAI5161897.1 transcription initiation factor TFIIE subunit beta [Nematocida ausubeli]
MDKTTYAKLSAGDPSSRHSNIYIHTILTAIKKCNRPLSFKEIELETGINIESTPGLFDLLVKNQRLVIEGKTLRFIPLHKIESEEELLEILKKTNSEHGIPVEELLDRSNDITPFIDSLVQKNQAIVLKDIDGSSTIFYNSMNIKNVDPVIIKLYEEVSVPEPRELAKKLMNAGMSMNISQEKPARKAIPIQKKKKYHRKIKITNTHLNNRELGI